MKIASQKSLIIILFSIFSGMIIGSLTGTTFTIFHVRLFIIFDVIGKLFLNSLSLIVAPLVVSAIIDGISQMGGEKSFKSVTLKTIFVFLCINALSLTIGFIAINLFSTWWEKAALSLSEIASKFIPETSAITPPEGFDKILLTIIPPNILEAFSKNQILSLILFSLIFGYAMTKIPKGPAETLKNFTSGIFQTFIQITHLIMKVLPLGVFGLVARQFALSGLKSLKPMFTLFLSELSCILLLAVVILLLLKLIVKISPIRFVKALSPALFTAFSTSSSSATLPLTIDCMENKVGVSSRITSFVVPLSTSLNTAASGLYIYLSIAFLSHVVGMPLSLSSELLLLFLTFIMIMGIPGLPSGGLVTVMILLKAMSLPVESIGLLLIIDRILDMFRTMVNVICGSSSTLLVANWEKEKNFLLKK